ncbi:putative oxidoreductase [Caenibius tardaugens NBRC 16725]|uniref:Putative oxidoreductase n=1 Tax=Caenibius tardaugens NBRC 16725 TaxID=1219035 RepID=U2Y380_9SPHN|nr:SDR family NAD(P)-dependent oxidoreductase [Caenibius tardaugens]AZI37338.1 SDR family NAD(P)-dependent oxidoreductase [Caenibius tardaugens NBRC 16725]GAD47406.1 putative oxidoreductase [Caenibius tardaugens NBRC 16725]
MARKVVVTGGFGALGRVVADRFASQGDRVARVDFAPTAPGGNEGGLDFAGVDLTDATACRDLVAKLEVQLGGIDVLVNIAGGFIWETLGEGSIENWNRMFTMNVLTAATITQAALAPLKASASGRIVNIGAGAAVKAEMGMGSYASSKAGVHRLTEALAAELAGTGVTVNAILPSIIDTPTNRADMPDADTSAWVKPQAIADVIAFLASDQARAITGALIPVTRGSEG